MVCLFIKMKKNIKAQTSQQAVQEFVGEISSAWERAKKVPSSCAFGKGYIMS